MEDLLGINSEIMANVIAAVPDPFLEGTRDLARFAAGDQEGGWSVVAADPAVAEVGRTE
jgi:hypothetical protein